MWYKFEQSDWFGINYHIGILVYSDEVEQLAMMEESLNEDFQIEEDMEVAERESTKVQAKCQEERCEAVVQEGRYEAVVMKYEVVAVQCEMQSARGKAEAVTQEATVEGETEAGLIAPGRPLWA